MPASKKTQSFRATIFKAGINPCVDVPARVSAALGRKGYVPVECRINGHAFRSGLVSLGGGRHRLFINGGMRREAGVEAGDAIEVRLRYDPEPRSLPLPGELARALRADRAAKDAWERLTPSRRKEILSYLASLKRPETVARNVRKVLKELGS
ncbi:MAG: YdeI/OmpD-associated family protein [Planctomycetota bacterium]